MANHNEVNEQNKSGTKEQMMKTLVEDNSRAFLDDIKPAMTQTKLEAESTWWKSLGKENPAAAKLASPEDLKKMKDQGWNVTQNDNFTNISRDSADGKLRESDTYSNMSGVRLGQQFVRVDNKESLDNGKFKQFIDVSFKDDGNSVSSLSVRSGDYGSEFRAIFDNNGKLASASEHDRSKNYTDYSFNENGIVSEALSRSSKDSTVVNDILFNSKGEQRSDLNPLYLYEKIKRPVVDLYLGIQETRRSGGMF